MASWFTRHSALGLSLAHRQHKRHWYCLETRMCNISVCVETQQDKTHANVSVISLVWLFSRQISLALLPFSVYSVFHVATYTRTNLIPTFQSPKPNAAGANPQSPQAAKSQSGLAAAIGKFVKEYYDSSMMLVAALEIALWGRLFLSAITFSRGSWLLLGLYTVFLRARYHQSTFVQGAFSQFAARIDQQVNQQSIPAPARQAWETIKGLSRQAVDATDVRKYLGNGQTAPKKAQ